MIINETITVKIEMIKQIDMENRRWNVLIGYYLCLLINVYWKNRDFYTSQKESIFCVHLTKPNIEMQTYHSLSLMIISMHKSDIVFNGISD